MKDTVRMTEPNVAQMARKLFLALETLRSLDPNLPVNFVQVFLAVAAAPRDKGIETRALPERVDLSNSAVNRAVTYLGDRHWKTPDRPGLGLVECKVDPYDRRMRIAKLTPKGQRVVDNMRELLYG